MKTYSAAEIADLILVIEEHGHYAEALPDGTIRARSIGIDANGDIFEQEDILPVSRYAIKLWLGY